MDITLDQANRIIALALQRSAEAGYKPMAVVVLDASGHTRSAQRQDGASMFRIDIATGKAWASIAMGAAVARADPARQGSAGVLRRPRCHRQRQVHPADRRRC
jgi:uncharacterized protein GlcG (DUF336 family)